MGSLISIITKNAVNMRLVTFSKGLLIILCFSFSTILFSQHSENSFSQEGSQQYETAPVTLDGNILFNVRGVSALPAQQRAKEISKRIKTVTHHTVISEFCKLGGVKNVEELKRR